MGSVQSQQARVTAAAMAALTHTPVPTESRTPRKSRAPKRWAVTTATPAVMPKTKPSTTKMVLPTAPTAAKAPSPRRRPTMTMSASA